MGYVSKYLCRELCDATNATLNSFYDADRVDDLVIYAFLFAKACYASVTNSGMVWDVVFEMFCHDEITVQIDTTGEKICGYIGEQEVYLAELNSEIAEILYEAGTNYYKGSVDKEKLTVVFERPGVETTFNLLP